MRISGTAARRWSGRLAALSVLLAAPPAFAGWNTAEETISNHPTWIYAPGSTLGNGKHGLLVALHGCAQTNDDLRGFGNLPATAEAAGLVVAVPDVGSNNRAPGCWDYDRGTDGRHHVAEITGLTRTLVARGSLNVDPDQVYVVGLSSGAALSLLLGCSAPDLFAGVGAIAGPSVGSDQGSALVGAGAIPSTNVSDAIGKCKSLAGGKASFFGTQVTSIAYGDMDKDGPDARFPYTFGDTSHPGQYALVSVKWSQDNVSILKSVYGTGALGTATAVQDGKGSEQTATAGGQTRLGLLAVHDVGYAWPAGTGRPDSAGEGGLWIAQSGLDYPRYTADWLMRNNVRVGGPQVTVNPPTVSGATLAVTGSTSDTGQVSRGDNTLLRADNSGSFQRVDGHQGVATSAGDFSDSYSGLTDGRYEVTVTATNDASRTTSKTTGAVAVGHPPPPPQCQQYTASNFGHVQAGRAYDNLGFAHAKGSDQRIGLDNIFFVTT